MTTSSVSPAFHVLKSLVFETDIPYWSVSITPMDLAALVDECDETHVGDRLLDLAEAAVQLHEHTDHGPMLLTCSRGKLMLMVRYEEREP